MEWLRIVTTSPNILLDKPTLSMDGMPLEKMKTEKNTYTQMFVNSKKSVSYIGRH